MSNEAQQNELRKVTPVRRQLPQTKTRIKAGPARRSEAFGDPVGNYNFKIEIEGVADQLVY